MADHRQSSTDRENILRGVYEDNVRIRDRQPRGSNYTARTYVTGASGMLVLVVIFMLAANFVLTDGVPPAQPGENLAGESGIRAGQAVSPVPLEDAGDIPDASAYGSMASGSASLASLFDLSIRTIVIDPGHGGRDPGATGPGGLLEKEVTLDIAERLRSRLEGQYGYRVLLTRSSDSTLSLRERAEYSNEMEADLFVSVHLNSFPDDRVVAIETYYFGPEADAKGLRFAEIENRNSDYSVAEFNRMVQRVGDRIKLQESRNVARHVQRSLFGNTRDLSENVADWGVKTAPFVVLVGADAPGILAEVGALSNPEHESRLQTPEYREQIAMFLEEGIVNYLTQRSPIDSPTSTTPGNATEEEEDE